MDFVNLFKYCPQCGSNMFVINNEKSKHCESCGYVFYMNASAAVAAFIQNENKELLVCIRAKEPAKGTWDLAGGFVDTNETAEEAIKREIHEELKADVSDAQYLFSLPNQYEYSGLTIPTLDMFYICKLTQYKHLNPSDDVESYFFIPLDEINPENFGLNSIKKAVQMYINR